MTRDRLRLAALARRVLLPPVLAGVAVSCLLGALALTAAAGSRAKAGIPVAGAKDQRELEVALTLDLEGTPAPRDLQRARRPLSERLRLLDKHPYFDLYALAQRRFGVPWVLVASIHYQETGFGRSASRLVASPAWKRYRNASHRMTRPVRYPHRRTSHPSSRDDFDVVMAIAAQLRAANARKELDGAAVRAVARRYGAHPEGRVSAAMVVERANAWRLLGTIPEPGRGELATPVAGVVGGCGYFGCPRPGRLHNGVDFLAPTGTPIHAADGGVVALVESSAQSGGYGNFVCVQHRPHLSSCYAHLSVVAAQVAAGARVRRGQVIGLVGSTGSSSAPHLHFEVRRGPASCQGCAVDPLPLLSGEVPESSVPKMLQAVAGAGPVARATPPAGAAMLPVAPPAAPVVAPGGPPPVDLPAPRMTGVTPSPSRKSVPPVAKTVPVPAPASHPEAGGAPPPAAPAGEPPPATAPPGAATSSGGAAPAPDASLPPPPAAPAAPAEPAKSPPPESAAAPDPPPR